MVRLHRAVRLQQPQHFQKHATLCRRTTTSRTPNELPLQPIRQRMGHPNCPRPRSNISSRRLVPPLYNLLPTSPQHSTLRPRPHRSAHSQHKHHQHQLLPTRPTRALAAQHAHAISQRHAVPALGPGSAVPPRLLRHLRGPDARPGRPAALGEELCIGDAGRL